MVHTPCRLPLCFPVTVWISFSVPLGFMHKAAIVGCTAVSWTQLLLCPWHPLGLLFSWSLVSFRVSLHVWYSCLFHFVAMLLIVLDRIVLTGMRHLCPQGGQGMCIPFLFWDPTRNLMFWRIHLMGGNWIVFCLLWFQSGVFLLLDRLL